MKPTDEKDLRGRLSDEALEKVSGGCSYCPTAYPDMPKKARYSV